MNADVSQERGLTKSTYLEDVNIKMVVKYRGVDENS